jgi:aquaporin Z
MVTQSLSPLSWSEALRQHWPEYLIEAAGLGTFMVSATTFGALFWYPGSPASTVVTSEFLRRVLMGVAMGGTAVGIIYSPWGQRSGAHLNPAVTLAFLRLGKIRGVDALFYITAQFLGGLGGVLLVAAVAGRALADDGVRYVVTVPGVAGVSVAFVAEMAISAGMMLMVLVATSSPRLERFTGVFAGVLLLIYITAEAPLSGMSINPARTVASALPAGIWTEVWVYFVGPIAGMMLAVDMHRLLRPRTGIRCAKLIHGRKQRCIHCGYRMDGEPPS